MTKRTEISSTHSLSPLEHEAIKVIERGKGNWGWYQVARALPVGQFPEERIRPQALMVRLEQLGLIQFDRDKIQWGGV